MRSFILTLALALVAPLAHAQYSGPVREARVNGGGHDITADGRLMLHSRTNGWFVRTLRPEGGISGLSHQNRDLLEVVPNDAIEPVHNWVGICEENPGPRRCRPAERPAERIAPGFNYTYNRRGEHACYAMVLFDTDQPANLFRRRELYVAVANPETPEAVAVDSFATRSSFLPTPSGSPGPMSGIEPSLTADGRLMVWSTCRDCVTNPGAPGNGYLVYSFNESGPCRAGGWSRPRSLAALHTDPHDEVRLMYRLARLPMRRTDGREYAPSDVIRGNYPWIDDDGGLIMFTSQIVTHAKNQTGGSERTNRGGLAVLGWPTLNAQVVVDGDINPDFGAPNPSACTVATDEQNCAAGRLFMSTPGPFEYADLPLVPGAWPLFHSSRDEYTELVFPLEDPRLAAAAHFVPHVRDAVGNESRTDTEQVDFTRTPMSVASPDRPVLLGELVGGLRLTSKSLGGRHGAMADRGLVGAALRFDGRDDAVVYDDRFGEMNGRSALGVTVLARLEAEFGRCGSDRQVIAERTDQSGQVTWELSVTARGELRGEVRLANGELHSVTADADGIRGRDAVEVGLWRTAAGELSLSIDHATVGGRNGARGNASSAAGEVRVGAGRGPGCGFAGVLDELRIYRRP